MPINLMMMIIMIMIMITIMIMIMIMIMIIIIITIIIIIKHLYTANTSSSLPKFFWFVSSERDIHHTTSLSLGKFIKNSNKIAKPSPIS